MRNYGILLGVVALAALAANPATATVITIQAACAYSGTAPAESAPWLTATFDDHNTSGSVTLALTATNLTGEENVKNWYLNLDPAMDPNNLTFSVLTNVGNFDTPTIGLTKGGFKADGDGYYDILFSFATNDGVEHRFGRDPVSGAESTSYTVDGIPSLTAGSFNFLSDQDGGEGIYHMAAHVQNTGAAGDQSGWVAEVPEPATLSLLALGGLAMLRRRRN